MFNENPLLSPFLLMLAEKTEKIQSPLLTLWTSTDDRECMKNIQTVFEFEMLQNKYFMKWSDKLTR